MIGAAQVKYSTYFLPLNSMHIVHLIERERERESEREREREPGRELQLKILQGILRNC
jgi:hypothetical protein